jgi:maltoporin
MKTRRSYLLFSVLILLATNALSQSAIMYQYGRPIKGIEVGWGSYGRVGAGWTGNATGVDGRRLNLNNMGSIGGRFEEQDYLELGV